MYGMLKNTSKLWINRNAIIQIKQSSVIKRYSTTSQLLPDIEYAELQKKLEAGEITLIDVRNTKELIKDGKIPQSKNIVLWGMGGTMMLSSEKFEAKHGFKKPELDAPIAVMCLGGIRARTAQFCLKGHGYTNIRNYYGSFEDWVEKGGPVEYAEDK